MQVIYTCPECGGDLIGFSTASIPPIYSMMCLNCGWHSGEEKEEIVRIPYANNVSNIPAACKACSSHPSNGGSGVCHCILGMQTTYC